MITLPVKVIPRASKPGIAGTRDGAILVRLNSPPVDGAANAELIDIIARAFGVPRRDVALVSGDRSKLKRVAIATIDQPQFEARLRSMGINPEEFAS